MNTPETLVRAAFGSDENIEVVTSVIPLDLRESTEYSEETMRREDTANPLASNTFSSIDDLGVVVLPAGSAPKDDAGKINTRRDTSPAILPTGSQSPQIMETRTIEAIPLIADSDDYELVLEEEVNAEKVKREAAIEQEESFLPPVLITESFFDVKSMRTNTSTASSGRIRFQKSLENYSGFSGDSKIDKTAEELWAERSQIVSQMLDDDDLWDTDLEDEEIEDFDLSGKSSYRELCEKLRVVPVSYFLEHIMDPRIVMRHHGLGPKGTKAIAKTLQSNTVVEYLDLTGNWMEAEGGFAMGKMLMVNTYITELILSENRLHTEGVYPICQALMTNGYLRMLDLSANNIEDTACKWIADLLENNKNLVELRLSRNSIGSDGGEDLGEAIAYNDILEVLDLSWNKIRGTGGITLINGIKENVRIKRCNIAWNGFGLEGGQPLVEMIAENQALQELDISGNRLDTATAAAIGKSLTRNECLEKLYIGHNPMKTTELLQLIIEIHRTENSPLCELNLNDVPVNLEFIKTVEEIQRLRPTFTCSWGLELRGGNSSDEASLKSLIDPKQPIVLLREHILINDPRFIEILQRMDIEGNRCVTVEEFSMAAKELGASLSEAQINEVRANLDKYGNGTIYYGDFVKPFLKQEIEDCGASNHS